MDIKKKFWDSIKRGTGEAYFIMKKNPNIDFSKEIIKASLKNLSYDNQCEGSRAKYVYGLIQLIKSDKRGKIRNIILKKILETKLGDWELVQLFDLASLFAKEGDSEAKKIIYRRFYKNKDYSIKWAGQDAIIDLDGFEGLKFIVRTIGKYLTKHVDAWEDSFLLDYFQENHPEIDVYKTLKKESENDIYIKKYLDVIVQDKKESLKLRKEREKKKLNSEIIIESVKNYTRPPVGPANVKELSDKDIKKLSDYFSQEKDEEKKGKLLVVFSFLLFPFKYLSYKEIIDFSKKKKFRHYAIRCLEKLKSQEIRKFAIEKISKGISGSEYLDLLTENYTPGDEKILIRLIKKSKNEHILHGMSGSLLKIFEKNKTKESKKILEYIYTTTNCGMCRNRAVRILFDNDILLKRIKKEVQFDSYDETRDMFHKL